MWKYLVQGRWIYLNNAPTQLIYLLQRRHFSKMSTACIISLFKRCISSSPRSFRKSYFLIEKSPDDLNSAKMPSQLVCLGSIEAREFRIGRGGVPLLTMMVQMERIVFAWWRYSIYTLGKVASGFLFPSFLQLPTARWYNSSLRRWPLGGDLRDPQCNSDCVFMESFVRLGDTLGESLTEDKHDQEIYIVTVVRRNGENRTAREYDKSKSEPRASDWNTSRMFEKMEIVRWSSGG